MFDIILCLLALEEHIVSLVCAHNFFFCILFPCCYVQRCQYISKGSMYGNSQLSSVNNLLGIKINRNMDISGEHLAWVMMNWSNSV